MAEKHLTEAAWKAYAKGRSYKDATLIKALADWGRAERGGHEAQASCLEALEKQADALLKANKGDKELAAYLVDMGKAIERARKATEQAAKQAATLATKADDEDDESPDLLTTKMLPLLRQVAKGQTMQALLASAGKVVVVMLSRKPIAPARRKLLAEQLGVAGGIKYYSGICEFAENITTFALSSEVAGLAKKIRAALLLQTGLRVKVRCRGADGTTDDDGEPADGAPQLQAAQPGGAAAAGDAFKARLTALLPSIKQALAAGGDAAQQAKLRASEAGALAGKSNFAAALALLDQVEALLGTAAAPAAVQSLVQLGKARIEWGNARVHALGELARLKNILQDAYREDAGEQEALAKALQRVDATIASMDKELDDRLDQVINAQALQRTDLAKAAKATLQRLINLVSNDQILQNIDGNEMAPEMSVAEPLRARLKDIAASLA